MEMQVVDKLFDILEQEIETYNDILEISKNKKNIIIKGKVNELESIVNLEQSLIVKMGKLEATREELLGQISGSIGVKASEINMSEIKEHLPEPRKIRMSDCQNRLSNVLTELKEANELNSRLIKNSLEFVNFAINLYTSMNVQGNNYASTGTFKEAGKRNLFDVKL